MLIGGNRAREALCGHASCLFVEPFARPEDDCAVLGFRAPLLVTSGNQVGRKLRSEHLEAVNDRVSSLLAALLAPHCQDSEVRGYGDLKLFRVRSKGSPREWARWRLPFRKNIRICQIKTICSGGYNPPALLGRREIVCERKLFFFSP